MRRLKQRIPRVTQTMKLSEAQRILSEAGIENARHDAMAIFESVGGFTRSSLMISDAETDSESVTRAVRRRADREPLQYIIGKTYFYNEIYEVNESVLIPRSDTEILVEYACNNIPRGERFLDLCTGSGCVGISTLKNTKDTTAVLVDISKDALAVARKNAELNGAFERVVLINSDVLKESVDGEFFAVLSNPPYVKDSVYKTLEKEIFHEPSIAFLGGDDGCDFYREITHKYKNKISRGGFIAYEIGYDQGDDLRLIAQNEDMVCEIIKDYSGNDRVAILKNKN